jgi:hypothetical protein
MTTAIPACSSAWWKHDKTVWCCNNRTCFHFHLAHIKAGMPLKLSYPCKNHQEPDYKSLKHR